MADAGTVRIPLFFEADLVGTTGDPGVIIIAVRGGRIVMEDGTIVGEIVFDSPDVI